MRIVVTGTNGLVGSRLAKLLGERDFEVVGLSRGEQRTTGHYRYQSVDCSREEQLTPALEAARPQVIVNAASMTEVDACERAPDQAYAANVIAPALLAQAARRLDAHLLHVSTDYVFDGEAGPYDEEAIPNPRGVYAITKHMGEQAVRALAPSWAIARTAVVYGWPAAGRPNFGAWLVGELEKQKEVKLFEDQFVSPSYAHSVARMLAELAERQLPGIWNVSGAEVMDRVTFGRALCEVFGFNPKLLVPTKLLDLKLASPRPMRSGLLVTKARSALSANPLELREALTRFHADYVKAQGGA